MVRGKVEERNWRKVQKRFWGNGNIWYLDDMWVYRGVCPSKAELLKTFI